MDNLPPGCTQRQIDRRFDDGCNGNHAPVLRGRRWECEDCGEELDSE